jgi:hypothetical protein
MKKQSRRPDLRRFLARAASAIRRRPRTATAAVTALVVVAIAVGGSLVLLGSKPNPAETAGQPSFTYADGWSLV